MPFYKYHCETCDKDITVFKKITEYDSHEKCEICGNPMKRKIEDMVSDYVCKCGGFYGKTSH